MCNGSSYAITAGPSWSIVDENVTRIPLPTSYVSIMTIDDQLVRFNFMVMVMVMVIVIFMVMVMVMIMLIVMVIDYGFGL